MIQKMKKILLVIPIVGVIALSSAAGSMLAANSPGESGLSGVRIPFVAGPGRNRSDVAFSAPTFAGSFLVKRSGEMVYLLPRKGARAALTEIPEGGRGRPAAGRPSCTSVSEFRGRDPKRWRSRVPTFESVSLGSVWPGISLDLRARGRSVEKIFTIHPGGDPSRIRMRVGGARRLTRDGAGSLIAQTDLGDVSFTPPFASQVRDGVRVPVAVAYDVNGTRYRFKLGAYDPGLPVVIDPVFRATYLGGNNDDEAFALAIDPASGDVDVAGLTYSTDLAGTTGSAQPAKGFLPYSDAFVARLSADLTTLEQMTYLGGSGVDAAFALAIDPASGDVYVAGTTTSTDFPAATGGAQGLNASNGNTVIFPDAFVARLNGDLTTLVQSTYLGGANSEAAQAIAIHPTSGDVYVTGWTLSSDFPKTSGGAHSGSAGYADVFIARLSADLKTLDQATYLGGGAYDQANAIAIHPASGNVYIAGFTLSTDFRETSGGAQPAHATDSGNADGFVAELDAALAVVEQVTYIGGSGADTVRALTINPTSGDVYVAGYSDSADLPGTSGGAQPGAAGAADAFVARFSASLTTLDQATYLGGSGSDAANALAIDPVSGDVFIAGLTGSSDLPGTSGAIQETGGAGGVEDAFAARLSSDLATLRQVTYLGGSSTDGANALAIHPTSGDVYIAGTTQSADVPGTGGAAQPAHAADGGGEDAFVAVLPSTLQPIPPVLLSVSLDPAEVVGGAPSQGTVTLSEPAPADGALVLLSAAAPASVPASVTVAAGSLSATFALTTSGVSAETVATISASYAGVTLDAALTVDPIPVPGALPVTRNPVVPITDPGR